MKRIAVTQRVDVHPDRKERRDALDQRWSRLLASADCLAIPVPNDPKSTAAFFESGSFDGLLLTGGNDLVALGGDTPERDETERILVEYAEAENLPILGICRGMQFLLWLTGVCLVPVRGHVACRHIIKGPQMHREVNSYHAWAATTCNEHWEILAKSGDGIIEAVRRRNRPLFGWMWHPEREDPFHPSDLEGIRHVFCVDT